MVEEFWLSDEQWARLAPLLPKKPRAVPRVDDRRVISGIVHCAEIGRARGRGVLRPAQEAVQPVRSLGGERGVVRGVRGVGRGPQPVQLNGSA